MEPIARISLPTHHPAVAKCGDNDEVMVRAKRVKTEPEEMPHMASGGRVKGPQPPPVNTDFHVTDISPAEGSPAEEAAETAGQERAEQRKSKKKGGPLEYLKSRQK